MHCKELLGGFIRILQGLHTRNCKRPRSSCQGPEENFARSWQKDLLLLKRILQDLGTRTPQEPPIRAFIQASNTRHLQDLHARTRQRGSHQDLHKTAAATAAQTRYLSSPAAATLHGKTQGFVLRLPPENIAHATSCSHYNAVCSINSQTCTYLRTEQHQNTR